jgi:TPR repeat protein
MTDVAHDTSGQAPSQTSVRAPDRGKLRVFISYSREDLDFADQLNAALDIYGFECLIDRQGISGGEDWKRRLGSLIGEADTVVFVLSPASAHSEMCSWEADEAARLNKRILPILCRPLGVASPPARLRDLNYIFFYTEPKATGSGFGTGLASRVTALNTDFDWLREHTRYLQRASEWDAGRRPANRLLSGNDILEAKAWAARRPRNAPELTTLHLDFIRAGEEEAEARSSAQRVQLAAVAAAQEQRETALQKAEEALRKRATMARIRNIALVAVSILVLLAGWLGWRAEQQRRTAEEQRQQADEILARATNVIVNTQDRMDFATQTEAVAVFQKGAEHGDASATRNLGVSYRDGKGVEQDYAKALAWYERAAAKGEANAMADLGLLYENGRGVAQDYVRAREWYEQAAATGDAGAMRNLGLLYENGRGVAQDYAKARAWYEQAAAKGNASAMVDHGLLYESGHGVTQDYVKARERYEQAAAKGDAGAMRNVAVLYDNGRGVAQDYVRAREWYEQAAAKGNASAMVELGLLYDNGRGVAQDYAKARAWYEQAAAKGNASAMLNLGLLYENGRGVAQDYAKARAWYEQAAAKGDARAKAYGLPLANSWPVTRPTSHASPASSSCTRSNKSAPDPLGRQRLWSVRPSTLEAIRQMTCGFMRTLVGRSWTRSASRVR